MYIYFLTSILQLFEFPPYWNANDMTISRVGHRQGVQRNQEVQRSSNSFAELKYQLLGRGMSDKEIEATVGFPPGDFRAAKGTDELPIRRIVPDLGWKFDSGTILVWLDADRKLQAKFLRLPSR